MLHHPNSSVGNLKTRRLDKKVQVYSSCLHFCTTKKIPSFQMFFKDLAAWLTLHILWFTFFKPLTIQFPFSNRCRCHPHNHLKLLSKHSLLMPHSFEFLYVRSIALCRTDSDLVETRILLKNLSSIQGEGKNTYIISFK